MARHRPALAAGLIAAASVLAVCASLEAQSLDRISVGPIALTADPARLPVGATLHLVMRVHVDQRVGQLDNVNLPNLSGFDVLGDERRCVPAGTGTDCTESLTLSPTVAGTHAIGPVTLDAIDARTNRPTHFASNGVTVVATPEAGTGGEAPSLLYVTMRQVLVLALAAMLVLLLIWAAGLSRRRAARRRVAPPPLPPAPPPPVVDPDAELRRAMEALWIEPTRHRAWTVRALLRERAGARPDETLSSLVGRTNHEPRLAAALTAVERPAFVLDADVAAAVAGSHAVLAALLTPPPTAASLEDTMSHAVTWKPLDDAPALPKSELPESAFAFPRERKEPLTDAGHVRSALARFNQVEGVSDDERAQAFANIRAAAEHYGVNVTETSWRDFFTN